MQDLIAARAELAEALDPDHVGQIQRRHSAQLATLDFSAQDFLPAGYWELSAEQKAEWTAHSANITRLKAKVAKLEDRYGLAPDEVEVLAKQLSTEKIRANDDGYWPVKGYFCPKGHEHNRGGGKCRLVACGRPVSQRRISVPVS